MLKAYRLTESDWYAAHDYEEAVRLAIVHTGNAENAIDESFANKCPEKPSTPINNSSSSNIITFGDMLDLMDKPGYLIGFSD